MLDLPIARDLSRWEFFEKTLLVAVVIDLALGGNGYLVKIGPFRVREVLFVVCMAWVIARLTKINPIRLDRNILIISGAFFVVTAFDAALGYFNGSRFGAIVAELKPLGYFPMLLFFLVAIRTRYDLRLVASVLVVCGTLVASLYLLLLLSAKVGIFSYSGIFETLRFSDEFIFRNNPSQGGVFVGFLYKGAFYISIAALFLMFDPFRITKVLAAVTVVATAMTVTRGLCLALIVSIVCGVVLQRRWRRMPLLLGQAGLLLAVLLVAQQAETRLLISTGDFSRETHGSPDPIKDPVSPSLLEGIQRPTDSYRTEDIKFVARELDFSMATIGRGLGSPIRGRERIEITYLEIFYKQGILGLAVWLALFLYILHLYLATPRQVKDVALAYFLAALFVFVATASNTFLTGSIGMGVVFISTASLLVLSREDPRDTSGSPWYSRYLSGTFRM
ncbi:hypothetical protein [Bradyrhizobium sp.]|uniref:hypothetical protein n=1 Tax=Bradyrhizobium sp. TaxID=376 RepID=UPI00273755F8|nr:hypothetical protein [Bradyrhizobium sp.]MDP3075376.1 hypothetical protein [Bradyrhizobium sp.]